MPSPFLEQHWSALSCKSLAAGDVVHAAQSQTSLTAACCPAHTALAALCRMDSMSDADLLALFEELLQEGGNHDASMQLLGLTQQQAAPRPGAARASASADSSIKDKGSMIEGPFTGRPQSGSTASTSGVPERRTAQEPAKQLKRAWEVSCTEIRQSPKQHGAPQLAPGRHLEARHAAQGTCGSLQGKLAAGASSFGDVASQDQPSCANMQTWPDIALHGTAPLPACRAWVRS